MTTTADAFLADIIAHPHDDAVRLIYADWLQEQGDSARAEFIRVQVELAQHQAAARCTGGEEVGRKEQCQCEDARRYYTLRRQELHRLYHGADEWLKGMPAETANWPVADTDGRGVVNVSIGIRAASYTFCRGFVEEMSCEAAGFLTHADTLRAAAPLRRVTLTTWPRVCGRDARSDPHGCEYRLEGRSTWWSIPREERVPAPDVTGYNPARWLLAAEFPGIEFTLPFGGVGETARQLMEAEAARTRTLREGNRRASGGPAAVQIDGQTFRVREFEHLPIPPILEPGPRRTAEQSRRRRLLRPRGSL